VTTMTTTEKGARTGKGRPLSPSDFAAIVGRLNRQSVEKRFEAYRDIDWDAPEMSLEHNSHLLELPEDDLLGRTEWYRSQPPEVRAAIGLERLATAAKTGLEFENVLMRGLLLFAYHRGNGDPSFRYIMHEISEECQHSMMFQELVDRSGLPIKGLPLPIKLLSHLVPLNALIFPELFFVFVLGGEDPIDYVQRRALRRQHNHPLIERIMRIHTMEEARHISFARHYLKHRVPHLPRWRRLRLAIITPFLLSAMAQLMLSPPRALIKRYGIPRNVVRQAYKSPEARAYVAESVSKIRALFEELGLITPFTRLLWRAAGLYQ
jgi:hypothetical protein